MNTKVLKKQRLNDELLRQANDAKEKITYIENCVVSVAKTQIHNSSSAKRNQESAHEKEPTKKKQTFLKIDDPKAN